MQMASAMGAAAATHPCLAATSQNAINLHLLQHDADLHYKTAGKVKHAPTCATCQCIAVPDATCE
jgi:hypothetical protein